MKNYHGVILGIDKGFYFTCRTYFMVYEDIGNLLSVFFFHTHSLHYLFYNVFRHTSYFFLYAPNLPIVQTVVKAKCCTWLVSVQLKLRSVREDLQNLVGISPNSSQFLQHLLFGFERAPDQCLAHKEVLHAEWVICWEVRLLLKQSILETIWREPWHVYTICFVTCYFFPPNPTNYPYNRVLRAKLNNKKKEFIWKISIIFLVNVLYREISLKNACIMTK